MTRLFALLAIAAVAAPASAQTNLASNPGFETDADGDRIPDGWRSSGDEHVTQELTLGEAHAGNASAKLACTRFTAVSSASHAMLCQMDVPVRQGAYYRVAFWARAEEIESDVVSLALSDTSVWTNCGLDEAFAPTPDWRRYEFIFRSGRDCPVKSRLQLWFGSTGTLWVDDFEFVEGGRDLFHPGHTIPAAGVVNLVPNASFECGSGGWGSEQLDRLRHWGGSMNRLFGRLDSDEAFHGETSLRIELGPNCRPVSFFDYYDLHRQPIQAPAAANIGFVEVTPDEPHVLSVYMKAAKTDTPAVLALKQFQASSFQKAVRLTTDWQRYTLPFRPKSAWCYVLAGPDLRQKQDTAAPPDAVTVWLDAVQLERAEEPTGFQARLPVEVCLSPDEPGPALDWNDEVYAKLIASGIDAGRLRATAVDLSVTDFFGREVVGKKVPIKQNGPTVVKFGSGPELRGFLKITARSTVNGVATEQTVRLAVIPVQQGDDSRFGMNHAYPWPHLLDLCKKAGLTWARDWSCKWHQVEPEKGRFTFTETDRQINRPISHGLKVLGLLPFPSSHWSSGAPEDYDLTGGYISQREHVAYAPRDEAEFENYVARTVGHYKDRVTWWQVFNEPVFTSYSLPRKFGYSGADYARWTKAFARAARRANPDCRILAGMGYLREGEIMDDWKQFLGAGGLAGADAADIHHYPRLRSPEYIEPVLGELGRLMEEHGGRKPIWLTEYGYYADDDPSSVPIENSGFNIPLADEQLQAEYVVRWTVIMLAGGVEKIFYHAGTCDGVNRDSLGGIFFEYAGQPHKVYAAQAVMSHLFTPSCRFVKKLDLGKDVYAYQFRDGNRSLAAVWSTSSTNPTPIHLTNDNLKLQDMMARPQASREFTPNGTPIYITADGLTNETFAAALTIQR